MRQIKQEQMKDLSFHDFNVEKMELFQQNKTLKIIIDGGFLDLPGDEDYETLGRGVLFFHDWKSITIRKYSSMHEYTLIEGLPEGALKDLLEVSFSDEIVSLAGYGANVDNWLEWIIVKPKMHAEFEEYQE